MHSAQDASDIVADRRGSGKALWGIEPDDLEGRLPDFLPDVHEVREDAGDYLGECLAVDAGLGVLMEELEARGELENTLIVASGDHGIPVSRHSLAAVWVAILVIWVAVFSRCQRYCCCRACRVPSATSMTSAAR